MSEIDEFQQAIDHAVAKGDQCVNRSEREPVDELLEKFMHGESKG